MTRQELEEINDRLQVEIEGLKEQLRGAPPPEAGGENERLRAEVESLYESLRKSDEERADLRETVRTYQRQRQNELLETQEARRHVEDLKQIELNRVAQAAAELARERESLEEERGAKDAEVLEARREAGRARTAEGNWKAQSQAMYERMTEAQGERQRALDRLAASEARAQSLEGRCTALSTTIKRMEEAPPRPGWIEFLELLANNAGLIWIIFLALILLWGIVYVVGSIWNWMWR